MLCGSAPGKWLGKASWCPNGYGSPRHTTTFDRRHWLSCLFNCPQVCCTGVLYLLQIHKCICAYTLHVLHLQQVGVSKSFAVETACIECETLCNIASARAASARFGALKNAGFGIGLGRKRTAQLLKCTDQVVGKSVQSRTTLRDGPECEIALISGKHSKECFVHADLCTSGAHCWLHAERQNTGLALLPGPWPLL